MTKAVKKTWQWFVKTCVGLLICLLVYDHFAPVYENVSIKNVVRTEAGLRGKLTFTKIRDCRPVTGTIVAFAHYGDGYRIPVEVLNSRNEELRLKNFPPSQTPVTDYIVWKLAKEFPDPSIVTFAFDLKCITPMTNRIEWQKELPNL